MPDIASLQFNIDSSQAQRAIAALEALKASSIGVTQAASQQNQGLGVLTTGYAQQRDALAKLADTTAAYDGTLTGLIRKLNDQRSGVEASRNGFLAYVGTLNQATQAAVSFNATIEGLDRYVSKTRELNISIRDTATGLQAITAAQQNITTAGNAARVVLEQMGVSLKGISPTNPGAVLDQIASTMRGSQDTAAKLAQAQQIFGSSFDASAMQRLERQNYIPYATRQNTALQSTVNAQIDTTRFNSQRDIDANKRREDERLDNAGRFTQDPTLAGRLGLNLSGGISRIFQTREAELAEQRRIAALPADQRRPYTTLSSQIGDAYRGEPGSADQGIFGWMGRSSRQIDTYSANQENIRARQQDEIERLGPIHAGVNRIGRDIENTPYLSGILGLGTYKPYTQPVPLSAADKQKVQYESGQIMLGYGDSGLAAEVGAKRQYTDLTAGDRSRNYNLTSIGTPPPSGTDLPSWAGGSPHVDSNGLPTWAGGLPPAPGETGAMRKRYVDAFGETDGNRRYESQVVPNAALAVRYAGNAAEPIKDDTARNQALMAMPWTDRPRAQAQLDFLGRVGGPAAQVVQPGTTLQQLLTSPSLSGAQQDASNKQFQQGVTGGLQQGTEANDRQIEMQEALTKALKSGRAAAEDATRALSAFWEAKGRGANDTEATQAGAEAIAVALKQRGTQATAMTEQMRLQNDQTTQRVEKLREIAKFDPVTKLIAIGSFDIEQAIGAERKAGTLPNSQGQFTTPDGKVTRTVSNDEADSIVNARRVQMQAQKGAGDIAAGQAAADATIGAGNDAETMLGFIDKQGMSLERANAQLIIQKQLWAELANARAAGDKDAEVAAEARAAKQGKETDAALAKAAAERAGIVAKEATISAGAATTIANAPPGTQASNRAVVGVYQDWIKTHPGTTLESLVTDAANGNLPPELRGHAGTIIKAQQDESEAVIVPQRRTFEAMRATRARQNVLTARGQTGAARLLTAPVNNQDQIQSDFENAKLQADARDALAAQEAATTGPQMIGIEESRQRTAAANLPVGQAQSRLTAVGISQQVAAQGRAFDPSGATEGARAYNTLNAAIEKSTETIAMASLASRTQISDQQNVNAAIMQGSAAVKAAEIDNAAAAQMRELEGEKMKASTDGQIAKINAQIAALKGLVATQKEAAQSQAEGNTIGRTKSIGDSTEMQEALTARGMFSGPLDQRRTAENVRLAQQQKNDGTTDTEAGRGERTALKAKQAAEDAADQMNNLRNAAHGVGSAVESAFSAIVMHGQHGKTVARELSMAIGDVITKALIMKPLETALGNAASSGWSSFFSVASKGVGMFSGIPGAGGGLDASGSPMGGASAAIGNMDYYPTGSAVGNIIGGQGIHAYSDQIVSKPTLFRFAAGGKVGQMGEGGNPEAIMPLSRDASGRLGVRGGGDSQTIHINTPITVNGGAGGGGGQGMDPATLKSLQRALDDTVRTSVRGIINNERRPGGDLYR